jgi:TonB family protein
MTRIFAPSTREPVLNPDGASGLLLLIHFVAFVALVFPPGESPSKEMLLESMVVYLMPPDDLGPSQAAPGGLAWSSETRGTAEDGIATTELAVESVLSRRGDVPALDATALNVSTMAEAEEDALTVLEVDSAVVRHPDSAAPEYPAHLLQSGLEGLAEVRYVVDTLGSVDTLSYRVLRASHVDFAVSVRRALPNMRFRPAMQSGRPVRQLIEQTFRFQINPSLGRAALP